MGEYMSQETGKFQVRLTWIYWVLLLGLVVWAGWWINGALKLDNTSVKLKIIAISVGAIVVSPVLWLVADWLRQVAMPTVYFTGGFADSLKKRFFWHAGPQVSAMIILAFALPYFSIKVINAEKSAITKAARESGPAKEVVSAPTKPESADTSSGASELKCTSGAVLKSLKLNIVENFHARVNSEGKNVPMELLLAQTEVELTDVKLLESFPSGDLGCEATVGVDLGGELTSYGISGFSRTLSFAAGRLPSGEVYAEVFD
jgi:hypothetical protein